MMSEELPHGFEIPTESLDDVVFTFATFIKNFNNFVGLGLENTFCFNNSFVSSTAS